MITGRPSSTRHALAMLQVLGSEQVVAAGGSGVAELATLVGRDKSQVSRMLAALAEDGFAERDFTTRKYRLGWQIFALAARCGNRRLLDAAGPVLTRLVREIGESAHLSVLRGAEVLTLLTESSPRALHAVSWVGRLVPAASTSSGRALLLDHDLDQLRGVLGDGPWPPAAAPAPRDIGELYERIEAARIRGYAQVEEESEPGLVAVAAPVRDAGGRIIAAVNISAPKFRLGRRLPAAGRLVVAAAAELSGRLRRPLVEVEEALG